VEPKTFFQKTNIDLFDKTSCGLLKSSTSSHNMPNKQAHGCHEKMIVAESNNSSSSINNYFPSNENGSFGSNQINFLTPNSNGSNNFNGNPNSNHYDQSNKQYLPTRQISYQPQQISVNTNSSSANNASMSYNALSLNKNQVNQSKFYHNLFKSNIRLFIRNDFLSSAENNFH